MSIPEILSTIDYRISKNVFSRPQYQVALIVDKLKLITKSKFSSLLDIGGGFSRQYQPILSQLTKKYINLEIKKGPGVDKVGSVYKIPFKKNSIDAATLFMVMEHLSNPREALKECNRILHRGGYLMLTTVQYWHTHNHPSDYLRYTKSGLEIYCKDAGFEIVDIWSMGGPFLVIFHAIELNLSGSWRTIFSIIFYRIFDYLDLIIFNHYDKRYHSDSVGWSLIAKKI